MASAAQLKLAIDSQDEYIKLQKQARKKSLWGSIGRTVGGIIATVVTGGAASPMVAGMMAAGSSALIGGIAANQARISGGKFHKGEREDLKDKLGPLGEANIVASLQTGIKAGMGQAAKMGKDVAAAKASGGAEAAAKAKASYGGLDVANSTASKAWKKAGETLNYGKAVVGTAGYKIEQAVDPIVGNIKGDLATMDPRFKEFRLDDWNQLKDPNTGEWLMTPKEYKDKIMAANPKNFGLDVSPTGEWGDIEENLWNKDYSVEDIDSIMSGEYNIVSDTPSIRGTRPTSGASEILDSLERIEETPGFTVAAPKRTNWTTDELEEYIRSSRQMDYDSGRVELWEQSNDGIWQGEPNHDGTKTIKVGDFSKNQPAPKFNPDTGEVLENLTYDPSGELVYPNASNTIFNPDTGERLENLTLGTDASTIYQNKLNNANTNQVSNLSGEEYTTYLDSLFDTNNDTLNWAPSATDTTNWRK